MVPPKKNRGGGRGRAARGAGGVGRGRGTGRGPGRPPAPRSSQASRVESASASSSAPFPPARREAAAAFAPAPDRPTQTNTETSQGNIADPESGVSVSANLPTSPPSDLPKFGKLIAPEKQINWAKGVWYNFGYFEKCDGGQSQYARCLICAKKSSTDNKTLEPLPDVGPEKQPLGIVEIPGASTSKVQHHFYSHHTEYLAEFLEFKSFADTKREERQGAKRKHLSGVDSSGKRQAKLVVSNNNDLALDVKIDPEFQRVWDSAVCDFVAETQCSFSMVASNAFKKLSTKLI